MRVDSLKNKEREFKKTNQFLIPVDRWAIFGVTLVVVFSAVFMVSAWQNPSVAPPGGDLSASLNTGSTAQTKTGTLTIATSTYLATTGGNVGIGTTGPSELLHLMSSTAAKPVLRIENTNADNNPGLIHFIKDSTSPATDDLLGQLSFYGDDSGGTSTRFATIFARSADVTDTTEDGSIHFKHFVAGTDTEVMTLKTGNVGIGDTTPDLKLDVLGYGKFGDADGDPSTFDNGLSVANASGVPTSLFLWQAGAASGHVGFRASDSNLYIVNSYSDGLITNPAAIALTSAGNVGIGMTGPTYKLEVSGGETKLQQQAWQSVTFQNSWVVHNVTPGYFKDSLGIVHLRGGAKNGTVGCSNAIFTLPVGYRPGARKYFAVMSNNTLGRVDVETSGVVSLCDVGTNAAIYFDNVQFLAEL